MLALFGRAEVRDFADLYRLVERFGRETLLVEAAAADAGLEVNVLAQMMGTASDRVAPRTQDATSRTPATAGVSPWEDPEPVDPRLRNLGPTGTRYLRRLSSG